MTHGFGRGARIQSIVVEGCRRVFAVLEAVARRRVLACAVAGLLPVAIRLAMLWHAPIPQPVWDDEYTYLLGADTFASGRLSNPQHPMWVHFETLHVNSTPKYVSKFPPGQSLFLAFGQRVLGQPWYGVVISFGLMCAALCWMLQGWMPPVYALLGALLGVAQIGILRYWMDSYCGGAVTAMGGCLVLGAAIRLARGGRAVAAALGAFGVVVLMNTRPYEGLVTVIGGVMLMCWLGRPLRRIARVVLRPEVVIPVAVIGMLGIGWLGFYNYQTTGNAWTAAYVLNTKTYARSPQFWFLPDWLPPVYRNEVIQRIWSDWTYSQWVRARHNPLAVVPEFARSLYYFSMPLLVFAGLAGVVVNRSRKMWGAVLVVLFALGCLLLEVSVAPHYFAPFILLALVPAGYGLRWLRIRARRFGPALVLLFVAVTFSQSLRSDAYHNWQETPSRREVTHALEERGGRHVVFVKYDPGDPGLIDLVYNRADIDASQIVWARYMGEAEDKKLINYYPDRTPWIYEATPTPKRLLPYAHLTQDHAVR